MPAGQIYVGCTESEITFVYNAQGCIYSPGRGIWKGMERSSKTGADKKSLMTTFECFLTTTAGV